MFDRRNPTVWAALAPSEGQPRRMQERRIYSRDTACHSILETVIFNGSEIFFRVLFDIFCSRVALLNPYKNSEMGVLSTTEAMA